MKKADEKTIALEKELEILKGQLIEYTQRWKRALADYQNLEKRIAQERSDFVMYAAKKFIEKLLPVVDDLEKAQAHLQDQGLALALKKLALMFKEEGVERIETVGRDYDIHTMEAIAIVEGEMENKVVEELRTGYTMQGAILRAAQVKVSKKK